MARRSDSLHPLLKDRLLRLRTEWERAPLSSDPVEFAHLYKNRSDQEVVAFLAASMAFGRVASIRTTLSRILRPLGSSPARFLKHWDNAPLPEISALVYRWVSGTDLHNLLRSISSALREHGSLRSLLAANDDPRSPDFVPALGTFFDDLRSRTGTTPLTRGLRFLLPDPAAGGACKRAHLYLRWMIRTESPDLGLWAGPSFLSSRLLLPMDTHVHRISLRLGLTRRPTADLAASREATSALRQVDPEDPVSFDWALSRLGILSECVRDIRRSHCERCAVEDACRSAVRSRS